MIHRLLSLIGLTAPEDVLPLVQRSPEWPKTRAQHLKIQPRCAVCDTKKQLEVHHIEPVHVRPERELDFTNLVTLCRVHHLLFGHLGDFFSWNVDCLKDIGQWKAKFVGRPYAKSHPRKTP